jgi:sigma-B regulation protein RsbU (phosphoserine phosphatase)
VPFLCLVKTAENLLFITVGEKPTVEIAGEVLRNMEKKVEDLKTLMDISSVISSTLDFRELISVVIEKAKAVMDAEACSILIYNKDANRLEFEIALCEESSTSELLKKHVTLEMGQGIAGWVAQNLKPLVVEDVGSDERFCGDADKLTGFTTKSIIAVPLIGRGGLIGVAEVINPKKDYDMEIFQLLCRQFAIAIENSLFHRESLERERMKQELDIAAAIQKSFLPASPVFRKGNLMISAKNISAAKVGGDIYDFLEPAEGRVGVLIGDVSGKGVSAAIYMAKVSSDFRYIARLADSPSMALDRLNRSLAGSPRGMFLTGIYMIIDTATGNFHVSVAGHPPFLWLSGGDVRVMSLPAGPPLGIVPSEYPSAAFTLGRGDRLLLLTDGLFDAKNTDGQRLGFDALVKFVTAHMHEEQLIERLVDFADDFSGGGDRADDLTIVELKWGV